MFCPRCASEVQEDKKLCPTCGMDISAITEITRDKATEQPDDLALVKDALGSEYEILGELGRGGMAIVYKALDKSLEREVAVKVLPLSMAYDNEFVERFQREAKTAAKLEHPNVIPIYRVGKTGRIIYFVMKYLRGKSLGDLIDEKGPLAPEDIRRVLAQSADALGYAHESKVVHRDIKPDNIVFDEKGRAIVTDFGIAKAATGTKLTGTGMAIGTPYYMSPEQARAQDLDGRSDIYSLGVVAFQCLTGHVPFEGDDSFAVGIKHISQELPKPNLKTAAQKELFTIVEKMLAKAPEDRFQTTDQLIEALTGSPTTAATQAMAASDPSFPPVRASTPTTPLPQMAINDHASTPTKKKLSPIVMAGIVGFLIVGGGSAVWLSNRPTEDTGNTSQTTPTEVASNAQASESDNPVDAEATKGPEDAEGEGNGAEVTAQGAPVVDQESQGNATSNEQEPESESEQTVTPPVQEPEPEPEPQVSPAERRWRQAIADRFATIDDVATDRGYERRGNPITGRLADGANADHQITLLGETDYAIVGFCDEDCDDLDLTVFNSGDRQIDTDVAVDPTPQVEVSVRNRGLYRVNVSMPGCSASGCRYVIGVYAKAGESRPRRRKGQ